LRWIVIYGFCLFKEKSVVEADGSNDMNMYGLNLTGACWSSSGLREE
jgi:hypothetical protein